MASQAATSEQRPRNACYSLREAIELVQTDVDEDFGDDDSDFRPSEDNDSASESDREASGVGREEESMASDASDSTSETYRLYKRNHWG